MLRSFELVYYSFTGELLWIVLSYLHVIHQPLSIAVIIQINRAVLNDQQSFPVLVLISLLGVGYRMWDVLTV